MPPQLQPPYRLVVVGAGTSDPSSSRMLADRVTARVQSLAQSRGHSVTVAVIELRELAAEVTAALTTQLTGPRLRAAIAALAAADGLVVSTPVYKAGASGLFTSFFQVLDNDLLIGKPAVLAATAGTARHALVIDDQMRSLFAFLRALPVPTSLFAAPEDWSDDALGSRIDRAATELLLLMESGFARAVRDEAWASYQHEFGSAAAPSGDAASSSPGSSAGRSAGNGSAGRSAGSSANGSPGGSQLDIDLDSDLMRLATGGSALN
jgi:FMN reductase